MSGSVIASAESVASVGDLMRILHGHVRASKDSVSTTANASRVPPLALKYVYIIKIEVMACLTRGFLDLKSWCSSAQRATVTLFCSPLSLQKKKQTVPGSID